MENFVVSARKYRPQTFASVVGQSAITTTLKNSILKKQIAQAFLFCGPRGVGKTTCARIFAKSINCMNLTPEGEACNECESCKSFSASASFNIFELDAASNRGINEMKTLIEQVRIPPIAVDYKVYIIDEVHMLTPEAFNTFLKTLEEPPAYAKFILATTEKHKILPTILSRCQIYDFKRINIDDITQHLQFIAQQENITCEQDALHIIAQKSDGGLRDALSMFDQMVSFSDGNLTYSKVVENLNILDYDTFFTIIDSIHAGDMAQTLLLFNQVLEKGFEGQHFLAGLNEHLRNLAMCKTPSTLNLLTVADGAKAKYQQQAAMLDTVKLVNLLTLFTECEGSYRTANNKQLHVEVAMMRATVLEGEKIDPQKKNAENTVTTPASGNLQQNSPQFTINPPPRFRIGDYLPPDKLNTPTSIKEYSSQLSDNQIDISTPTPPTSTVSAEQKTVPEEQKTETSPTSPEQEQPTEKEEISTPINEEKTQPITVQPLEIDEQKWTQIVEQNIEGSTFAKTFLLQSIPQKVSDNQYNIIVDDTVKQERIKMELPAIVQWISKNYSLDIQFNIQVVKPENTKKVIDNANPHAVFEQMCIDNPALANFQQTLNLSIS
ncbi:MAG: DNA polymerase III subunit gamma/tau [Bacteroidales bacterium]|jgi:DNA polymerase-3 subunit gamma/tau|nr:DNA polymerase III subunit gamma/tau [Bacteroidales bacterium]